MDALDPLEQALNDTEAALKAAKQERDRRRREEDSLIEGLELERRGLQHAVARRRGEALPLDVGERDPADWTAMYRTDAIVKMLSQQARPLGPARLAHLLQSVGRQNDSAEVVGAALDHLKHQGKVASLGRGQWVAVHVSAPGSNGSEAPD